MSAVATVDEVEAVRDEMHREIEGLRYQMSELERRVAAGPAAPFKPRPLAERLAGLAQMRALREQILRERGGAPLPSSADEIRQMREERTAHILGEDVE